MALAFNVLKRFMPQKGGIRQLIVEITGDTSYPTGGTPIAAADFLLRNIISIRPSEPYPLVDRQYIWDRANAKLMSQVISTAAEVSNATNCSADKIVTMVVGS